MSELRQRRGEKAEEKAEEQGEWSPEQKKQVEEKLTRLGSGSLDLGTWGL